MSRRTFTMAFLATLALLGALKVRLEAMEMPGASVKVFGDVRFSARKNFLVAVQELRVADSDVCLIHPVGESYESRRVGATEEIEQTTEFMLILGTEDLSATAGEMLPYHGSPGILAMKDAVLREHADGGLVGSNLGFNGRERACLVPLAGALTELSYEEAGAEVAGRQVWQQLFRTRSGIVRTQPG